MAHGRLLPSFLFALAAVAAPAAAQTTWYVDVNGTPPGNGSQSSPYTSIQYALDRATTVHGDTLLVAPGSYVDNLSIAKRVRILGTQGADYTVLLAASPGALVKVSALDTQPQATLTGFTLDGSAHPSGTGIDLCCGTSVSLRLERCVIREFTAGRGVRNGSCFLDAFQSTISRNAVGVFVDLAVHSGLVSLYGGILRGNGVDYSGQPDELNAFYSAVPPKYVGGSTGNIGAPPRFWNHAAGDLHLKPGSPCIDAIPASFIPPDPDGSLADMGALTFDPAYSWGPVAYCQAKTSSVGCAAAVAWTGSPTASATGGFVVRANDVLSNVMGLAVYSFGNAEQPFQGGTLCVTPPFVRTPVQGSGGNPPPVDCSGALQLDLDAWIAGGAHPELAAGTLLYVQFWYRDPGDPFGSGLSDAVGFGLAP
jgi:hypothetical protein